MQYQNEHVIHQIKSRWHICKVRIQSFPPALYVSNTVPLLQEILS